MAKSVQNSQAVLRELLQYLQDEIKETKDHDEIFKSESYKRSKPKDRQIKEIAYNHGVHRGLERTLYHIKHEFEIE